jgi:hypothetical protein
MVRRFGFGKMGGLVIPLFENSSALYNIVRHKSDTIATAMETSPPNVMFRRDLSSIRLVSWNALLQCLANVHLQTGPDEFRWNLHYW